MLEGLATACGYGDPERHLTFVKRCNMELDAVLLMSCAYTADGLSCERIESRDQGGGPTRPAGLREPAQHTYGRHGEPDEGSSGP